MDLADFFCGLNIFLSSFISGHFRSLPVIRKKSENRKNRKSKNVIVFLKPQCQTYPESFFQFQKFLFWKTKSDTNGEEYCGSINLENETILRFLGVTKISRKKLKVPAVPSF